jgi:hypothetical protein
VKATIRIEPLKNRKVASMKLFKPLVTLLACGTMAGAFSGCAWSIGGGAKDKTNHPTRGQELIDLQRARDTGAITPDEYETQKRQVLSR